MGAARLGDFSNDNISDNVIHSCVWVRQDWEKRAKSLQDVVVAKVRLGLCCRKHACCGGNIVLCA